MEKLYNLQNKCRSMLTRFEVHLNNELMWILLGSAGGTAKVFGNWLSSENKPKFTKFLLVIFLNIFISGFTGYLGATVGSMITDIPKWSAIFAGIFGYLGVNGLELLSTWLKVKFDLPNQTTTI